MKSKLTLPSLLTVSALAFTSCGKKSESTPGAPETAAASNAPAAASGGTAGGVPLTTEFPPELIEGTPKPMNVPNLVQAPNKAPEFLVPEGTTLLSKGKKVSSDSNPIIGDLTLVTDGEKEAGEGYFLELLDGTQWVQIDLENGSSAESVGEFRLG
jgi:hypothetical protein